MRSLAAKGATAGLGAAQEADNFPTDEQRRIVVRAEGVILVHRPWAPSQRLAYSSFDLRDARLPPTPFAPLGTSVAARADLRDAVIQGLNSYIRSTKANKSQHRVLILRARCLVKALEYGWLMGVYRMSDWTSELFLSLARKLESGGWLEALDVRRRVERVLEQMTASEVAALWLPTHGSQVRIDGKKLARLMHCNIASHEIHRLQDYVALRLRRPLMREEDEVTRHEKKYATSSRTGLWSELSAINLFSQGSSPSLFFRPFPNAHVVARRHAAESGGQRTRSMGPGDAAALLQGAVHWIEVIAPVLQDVLQELLGKYRQVKKEDVDSHVRAELLAACKSRSALEQVLGCKVTSFQKVKVSLTETDRVTSLHAALKMLYAACFIIIALFNARRKDEIQHPVIGLHAESLSVANEGLKLYVCKFFIEKTVNGYVSFYVGQLTAAAIQRLTCFSNIAREFALLNPTCHNFEEPAEWQSIFLMPCLPSLGGYKAPSPFDFYLVSRQDRGMKNLGCDWLPNSLRPHMLRRAYALIFHYRYEDATLYALSQQLQHLDIEMTRVYVTDTVGTLVRDTGVSKYGRLTPAQRRALQIDRDVLESELKDVANEKLMQFVESVIDGRTAFSGGYVRLVQRFHQQFGRALSYSRLDMRDRADHLGGTLIARGHEPRPMAHGTCMAGTSASRLRGHCFNVETQALDRSDANPSKCACCPYHVVTKQHLEFLQAEYTRQESELNNQQNRTSIQNARRMLDLAALRKLIELHASRLTEGGLADAIQQ